MQVVLSKAWNKDAIGDAVNQKMIDFANRGLRSLGLAMAKGDGVGDADHRWEMLGLLPMFDPPRHDTKDTIEKCQVQGIEVKMITGDHLLIGKETARMLGMGTQVGRRDGLKYLTAHSILGRCSHVRCAAAKGSGGAHPTLSFLSLSVCCS